MPIDIIFRRNGSQNIQLLNKKCAPVCDRNFIDVVARISKAMQITRSAIPFALFTSIATSTTFAADEEDPPLKSRNAAKLPVEELLMVVLAVVVIDSEE